MTLLEAGGFPGSALEFAALLSNARQQLDQRAGFLLHKQGLLLRILFLHFLPDLQHPFLAKHRGKHIDLTVLSSFMCSSNH